MILMYSFLQYGRNASYKTVFSRVVLLIKLEYKGITPVCVRGFDTLKLGRFQVQEPGMSHAVLPGVPVSISHASSLAL